MPIAKKKAARAVPTSMEALHASLGKRYGSRAVRRDEVVKYEVIPTGSLTLDLATRVGGWVRGRIHELVGPEGVGKTTLMITSMAEAQRKYPGLAVGYIDMEQCLRGSELVRLADGRRVPARDLVGRKFSLYTSTPDGHQVVAASAEEMPESDIFRVTTESGRTLEVNGKHPLYRGVKRAPLTVRGMQVRGWTSVSDIHVGDYVAVPSRTAHEPDPASDQGLSEDEGFVIGALIGDGSVTVEATLTTPPGEFPMEFTRRVEALGDRVSHASVAGRAADVWTARPATPYERDANHTRTLLQEVGLLGLKSAEKFIPERAFSSKQDVMSALLGGLYAADGHVHVGAPKGKQVNGLLRIELDSTSRRLLSDAQEALLRFGVSSNIRVKRPVGRKSQGTFSNGKTLWTLQVTGCGDLIRFTDQISVPGKNDALDALRQRAVIISQSRGVRRWRSRNLNPDLRWERVDSIEALGREATVGLMVPEHHTYLSTFWEHNTFDYDWAEALGLDTSPMRFVHVQPDHAEDVSDMLRLQVETGLLSFVTVDSVGAMESQQALEKEAAEVTMGRNAQVITRMVKGSAVLARRNQVAVLLVNQLRANLSGMGSDISAGPKAMKYSTTMKVEMKPAFEDPIKYRIPGDKDDSIIGRMCRATVSRNKVAVQGKRAEFYLMNHDTPEYGPVGIDRVDEAINVGIATGVIKQGGAYYTLPTTSNEQGETKIKSRAAVGDHLRSCPDDLEIIREQVLAKMSGDVHEETETSFEPGGKE